MKRKGRARACPDQIESPLSSVMPALVAGIHVFCGLKRKNIHVRTLTPSPTLPASGGGSRLSSPLPLISLSTNLL
jgi:hypothetical protein